MSITYFESLLEVIGPKIGEDITHLWPEENNSNKRAGSRKTTFFGY